MFFSVSGIGIHNTLLVFGIGRNTTQVSLMCLAVVQVTANVCFQYLALVLV